MSSALAQIAEQRIREAMARGEFDGLEGQGKPQDLDEYFRCPEDARMVYGILKNADCLPPELEIKNDIIRIEDMLAELKDDREKYKQIKKLNFLVDKLNALRARPVAFEESQRYYPELTAKMTVKSDQDVGK